MAYTQTKRQQYKQAKRKIRNFLRGTHGSELASLQNQSAIETRLGFYGFDEEVIASAWYAVASFRHTK